MQKKHFILLGISAITTALLFRSQIAKLASEAVQLTNKYLGIKETDKAMQPFLLKIWQNLGYSASYAQKLIDNRTAWSAAYISWLMRDFDDFKKSASHSNYIVAARNNTQANTGKFKLRRIADYKPKVGDIVCKNRAGGNFTYDSIYSGAFSHCDLVVKVLPNSIITNGGNVSNGIKNTTVATKNGYINQSGYFAIIENQHK